MIERTKHEAIALLKQLIAIPSISREEKQKADFIEQYLLAKGCQVNRYQNNIVCYANHFDAERPTLMLNSHIDTVKPSASWVSDPFSPVDDGTRITGLGANDAHASVVSLIATFLLLRSEPLPYNLILALSAEEEVSGKNGMEYLIKQLPNIDFAIVGEPTNMQAAIAEKGLMVLDCTASGIAGHAARNEGVNAILVAMNDINWFSNYCFERIHPMLGKVKMTVTQINAGSQHNIIPDSCKFVVDVRSNGCYSNQELFDTVRAHISSKAEARSFRLNASNLPSSHVANAIFERLAIPVFASSTLSDLALMPFHGVKIGPGDSARSHTAGEYIVKQEIYSAIDTYLQLLRAWHF